MIRLRAFVACQIRSAFHSPAEFEEMGRRLAALLRSGEPPVDLIIQFGEFPPGTNLWTEVSEAVRAADLVIADISENNPNVLVEAGIAVGSSKQVVLTKSRDSESQYQLPSDLSGFVYLPYERPADLGEPNILQRLLKAVLHYLETSHDVTFFPRLLWSLPLRSRTLIIPGQLPDDWVGLPFEDYVHIRKYSDLDAVRIIMETLLRLYPDMEVALHPARKMSELPANWPTYNLIFIGGPDFNVLVQEFDDRCPFEYLYGPDSEVWLRHKATGVEYRPKFQRAPNKHTATDYGFFFKTPLAPNAATKLVLIGGARTWGVCGAAMLIGCTSYDRNAEGYRNSKELVRRLGSDPSFVVPVEVKGTKDGVHVPIWKLEAVERI